MRIGLLAGIISFSIVLLPGAGNVSWELEPFLRPATGNPAISPSKETLFQDPAGNQAVHWEALHTFNPAAVVRNGKIVVLYRAEDDSGEKMIGGHTSRLGLAESDDGIHFRREPAPVLFPANDAERDREWPGGCEDPRLVETEEGTYVLTYTQWNRKIFRAAVATSHDLHSWHKYGPIFAKAYGGKYADLHYKSAAIVTQLKEGRLIAARVQGKYWMYWGEGDIHLARSNDLIDWFPLEDAAGKLISVLSPRRGRFDSSFPEAGPPPVLGPHGILVIYNGKNDPTNGDPSLAPNAYSAGQALFAAGNPAHLLGREAEPFLRPEMPFERAGQYAAGTTFAEGLVFRAGKWFLYYGCADSLVGVAIH